MECSSCKALPRPHIYIPAPPSLFNTHTHARTHTQANKQTQTHTNSQIQTQTQTLTNTHTQTQTQTNNTNNTNKQQNLYKARNPYGACLLTPAFIVYISLPWISRDKPRSVTLHISFSPTSTFLAARSR